MKKLMFNALIILAFCSSAFSQSLQNTNWDVYNTSNVLEYKFRFGFDTTFVSQNLITFQPLSIFTVNGNVFTIHDIDGVAMACPAVDTGRYTFVMDNDSLFFTMISDPCGPRSAVLTSYNWVQNTIGIKTQQLAQAIQVFPNPSADGIFNLKVNEPRFNKYSVYNLEGKLILKTILIQGGDTEFCINLTDFESGMYFIILQSKQGNSICKLARR